CQSPPETTIRRESLRFPFVVVNFFEHKGNVVRGFGSASDERLRDSRFVPSLADRDVFEWTIAGPRSTGSRLG
ncbi:MAG: hypothetical protein ACRD1T_26960, partial [Acidimicrobiia bacterium]